MLSVSFIKQLLSGNNYYRYSQTSGRNRGLESKIWLKCLYPHIFRRKISQSSNGMKLMLEKLCFLVTEEFLVLEELLCFLTIYLLETKTGKGLLCDSLLFGAERGAASLWPCTAILLPGFPVVVLEEPDHCLVSALGFCAALGWRIEFKLTRVSSRRQSPPVELLLATSDCSVTAGAKEAWKAVKCPSEAQNHLCNNPGVLSAPAVQAHGGCTHKQEYFLWAVKLDLCYKEVKWGMLEKGGGFKKLQLIICSLSRFPAVSLDKCENVWSVVVLPAPTCWSSWWTAWHLPHFAKLSLHIYTSQFEGHALFAADTKLQVEFMERSQEYKKRKDSIHAWEFLALKALQRHTN